MNRMTRVALAALLGIALASVSGCMIRREYVGDGSAERHTFGTEVPLDGAASSNVRISMGAGELDLSGDDLGDDAFAGEFTYAPETLEPKVRSASGESVEVTVEQPNLAKRGAEWPFGEHVSEWTIRLAKGVPTDLRVTVGAGNCDLDLRGIELTSLTAEMGAGDLSLDLSGSRASDLVARVDNGAGNVEVRLPRSVGVRVTGKQDGVGDWEYGGFRTDGDALVNDLWGESETSIELHIQRGVGRVTLVLAD